MSGTIGTSNISFSSLVSTYNAIKDDDLSTSNISLSNFRGKEFTSGSVPSSGAISINDHFKGKTWKSDAPSFTLTRIGSSHWDSPSGSGTPSSPYKSWSGRRWDEGSTVRWIQYQVGGDAKVWIHARVSSEPGWDYGEFYVGNSRKWRASGENSTGWRSYNVSNGTKITFYFNRDKDWIFKSGSNGVYHQIYITAQ